MSEKLIPFSVEVDFSDGNLAPLFQELGYDPTIWKAHKVRNIPRSLALRVKSSGGELIIPEDGMSEEVFHPYTPPVDVKQDDQVARYRKQFAGEKKLRVMVMSTHGWSDGNDLPRQMFAALDMPASLQFTQIVELPMSVIEFLTNTGVELTAEKDELEQYEKMQNKFTQPLQAWRAANAAKIREKEAAEEAKQNAEAVKHSARRKLLKIMSEAEARALGLLL
jgi:hypothetical protein